MSPFFYMVLILSNIALINSLITCNPNFPCNISCSTNSPCINETIQCAQNHKCEVTCAGFHSSNALIINGSLSSELRINGCTDSNSLKKMYCPPNMNSSKMCTISGNDANLRNGVEYYATNGWADVKFNILNYTGDYSVSTSTMHCLSDYNASCVIGNISFECDPTGDTLCNDGISTSPSPTNRLTTAETELISTTDENIENNNRRRTLFGWGTVFGLDTAIIVCIGLSIPVCFVICSICYYCLEHTGNKAARELSENVIENADHAPTELKHYDSNMDVKNTNPLGNKANKQTLSAVTQMVIYNTDQKSHMPNAPVSFNRVFSQSSEHKNADSRKQPVFNNTFSQYSEQSNTNTNTNTINSSQQSQQSNYNNHTTDAYQTMIFTNAQSQRPNVNPTYNHNFGAHSYPNQNQQRQAQNVNNRVLQYIQEDTDQNIPQLPDLPPSKNQIAKPMQSQYHRNIHNQHTHIQHQQHHHQNQMNMQRYPLQMMHPRPPYIPHMNNNIAVQQQHLSVKNIQIIKHGLKKKSKKRESALSPVSSAYTQTTGRTSQTSRTSRSSMTYDTSVGDSSDQSADESDVSSKENSKSNHGVEDVEPPTPDINATNLNLPTVSSFRITVTSENNKDVQSPQLNTNVSNPTQSSYATTSYASSQRSSYASSYTDSSYQSSNTMESLDESVFIDVAYDDLDGNEHKNGSAQAPDPCLEDIIVHSTMEEVNKIAFKDIDEEMLDDIAEMMDFQDINCGNDTPISTHTMVLHDRRSDVTVNSPPQNTANDNKFPNINYRSNLDVLNEK